MTFETKHPASELAVSQAENLYLKEAFFSSEECATCEPINFREQSEEANLPHLSISFEQNSAELVRQLGSRSRGTRESARAALSLLGFEAVKELAEGCNSPNTLISTASEKLFEEAWRPRASRERLDEGHRLSLELHNKKPNLVPRVYELMSEIAEMTDHPAGRLHHKNERIRQLEVVEQLHRSGKVKLSPDHLAALKDEQRLLTRPDERTLWSLSQTKLHIAKALIWGGDSNSAKKYVLDAIKNVPAMAESHEFLVQVIEGELHKDKDFIKQFKARGGNPELLTEAARYIQPIPKEHPDGPHAPRRRR